MNVPIGPAAFVFRHKRTKQIVVVSNERWHEYYDNKENWEHTASINACLAIQYILSVGPRERNRYLRSLTEKI
jgi:aspartate aminotransferase-like enzyme